MTPEPEWWGWLLAWEFYRVDPRSLNMHDRWAMLEMRQEEDRAVLRWLQASVRG